MADGAGFSIAEAPPAEPWPDPDMTLLRMNRRPPPLFPLQVFGSSWEVWIRATAEAAACPVDYIAMPLLSSSSVLIGNARWAQVRPRGPNLLIFGPALLVSREMVSHLGVTAFCEMCSQR